MRLSDAESKSASQSAVVSTATTHLSGSWLIVARTVWLTLVIPSLGRFVVGLPAYYQQLQRACDSVTCNLNGALTAKGLQELASLGFSASTYAALLTIFFAIMAAIWCAVGFLLFWRKSDDWLALLASFYLVLSGIATFGTSFYVLSLTSRVLELPVSLVGFLTNASLAAFLVLFPNGRLVPRWMGLILLLFIIFEFFDNLPSRASPFDANWPGWLYVLENLVLYGAIIFSQIYRYRRVSTPVQRQQTKWVIFGTLPPLSVPACLHPLSMSKGLLRMMTVSLRASAKKTTPITNGTSVWEFVTLFVTKSRRGYGKILVWKAPPSASTRKELRHEPKASALTDRGKP